MLQALYTAATGMYGQEKHVDVISNNISNVNTTSYKRQRAEFADLFYQAKEYPGAATSSTTLHPTGIEVGLGSRMIGVNMMFDEGNLMNSSNNLDIAITGNGFFQIQMPDGTIGYTRDGALKIDANGNLVNHSGYPLSPNINVTGYQDISMGTDGTVTGIPLGQTTAVPIGNIQVSSFINPAGLHHLGGNMYKETVASGVATVGTPSQNGLGEIRQGFLEMSNVKLVEEMTSLIKAQRAYDANSKFIQAADEMLKKVDQLKR
jgi:flagellar basal-body rod protein FlgG